MTTTTRCRAKDPNTCPVHGSGVTVLTQTTAKKEAAAYIAQGNANPAEAKKHLQALTYFKATGSEEYKALAATTSLDIQKTTEAAERFRKVLEFEQSYSTNYGYGSNKEKEQAIQRKFNVSPVRYYQMLNNNPIVQHTKAQVAAKIPVQGNDFISKRERETAINTAVSEKLYGGDVELKNEVRSAQQIKDDFNRWEIAIEREQAIRADSSRVVADSPAGIRAENQYYAPKN
jgi:hypothetical protein